MFDGEQRQPPKKRYIAYVTYAYMIACFAMFAAEIALGGATNAATLVLLGAKYNPLILAGQWWRLITPMFLHIGLQHIAFNMFALYIWGRQVEAFMGKWRMAALLLISGIGSTAMSFAFNQAVAAGASGAIFGLFGALLMFRKRYRGLFDKFFGVQVLILLGFNIVMGIINTGIDNWGHVGGLASGFLAAEALGLPREPRRIEVRVLAAVGLVTIIGAFILWGARSVIFK